MFAARFNFPRFKGIYDARLHHDNIIPIRGTDIRPIGSRKRKDVSIRVEDNNVMLRFYGTDVITFLSNGDIHVYLGGWVTQSTRNFIYTALAGCFIAHGRMWIQTIKGWQALRPHEVNIFRRGENNEGWGLVFMNAPTLKTHSINRAGANNVRKQYAPFKSYVKRMFKLADPDGKKASVSRAAMSELFSNEHGVPKHLGVSGDSIVPTQAAMDFLELAASTDTADHYKAWVWLVFSAGYPSYQRDEHFCHYTQTTKLLDDLILWVNRGECFNEVDTPTGEAVKDRYAKFFG